MSSLLASARSNAVLLPGAERDDDAALSEAAFRPAGPPVCAADVFTAALDGGRAVAALAPSRRSLRGW